MGLGKTPIAISAAEELQQQGSINCCLVVCPPSLKYEWAQKIAQFTDLPRESKKVGDQSITIPVSQQCVLIDGDKKTRDDWYNLVIQHIYYPKYIIIGYDNVLNDYSYIAKLKTDMVVLDEATAIKSFKAQRSKKIKKLLRPPYRLALTGTPIENKPDELFSIMQWVDDTVLGRYDLYEKAYINRNKFGWVESYKNLPTLRDKIAPAISRLTSKDVSVAKFMPKAIEEDWYVDMDDSTKRIYKKIASDMLHQLSLENPYADFDMHDYYQGVDESKPSGKLMAMYMCLEMLLDHPDLIIWSGIKYTQERPGGSRYAYELWQSGSLDNVTSSPKLAKLISEIGKSSSGKILIYSQYKYMIEIINDHITNATQFHGGMPPVKKAESVAKFRNDPNCRFFLSSHAGAYGLDMNMSDLLINYDQSWSAGRQDQINHRNQRRSSTFTEVNIRNLITRNSVEERKARVLGRKRRLGSSILDGFGHDDTGSIVMAGDSLRDHLEAAMNS